MKFFFSLAIVFLAKAQQETADEVVQRVCAGKAVIITVDERYDIRGLIKFPFQDKRQIDECRRLSKAKVFKLYEMLPQNFRPRRQPFPRSYYTILGLPTALSDGSLEKFDGLSFDITRLDVAIVRHLFKEVPKIKKIGLVLHIKKWEELKDEINGNAANIHHIVIRFDPDHKSHFLVAVMMRTFPKVPISFMSGNSTVDANELAKLVDEYHPGHKVRYTAPPMYEESLYHFKTFEA